MGKSIKGVLSRKNISLKKFNTFRVNAKALEFYIEFEDEMKDMLKNIENNFFNLF